MFVIAKHVRFPSSESLFQFSQVMWPWESHLTSLSLHFVIILTCVQLIWSWSTSQHPPIILSTLSHSPWLLFSSKLLSYCFHVFIHAAFCRYPAFAGMQHIHGCNGLSVSRRQYFTALLHILFLLHIFCPTFQNGSWALGGKISMSHLGLNTQQSSILIASPGNESLDLLSPTEKRSFSGQG